MKTVAHAFIESFFEIPDQPAIFLQHSGQPDQTITWRRFIQGAVGYAEALAQAGIKSCEVAILILPHSQDLIYAFAGAVLHGAIPSIMPFLTEKLSPEHYRAGLSSLFEIVSPAVVVTYPEFEQEARQAAVGAASIRALIVSDTVFPRETPEIGDLPGLRRSPQEIALLQHSSGTTGLQKGVALSHLAIFNQLESYSASLHLDSSDVIVSWLPLYHDMGLIAGFLLPLLTRTPLVLMSPFDWIRAPGKLMQAISRYQGTLCWLPNFAYNFCAQKTRPSDLDGVDLASLRAIINCSEPMYLKSHEMFLSRFSSYGLRPQALATCYAMAENVFAVTQGGIGEPVAVDTVSSTSLMNERIARPAGPGERAVQLLSAGRPIASTSVRVVDDQGKGQPERQIGEIALQSNCMLTGYYHRPELTEKAFQDGWYLTGDLGYLADGELYITGRKKDLIIVGGKNIYPQDLEMLAGEVQGVHPGRVTAFGIYNDEAGTEEVVIVAEADFIEDEERARLAEAIRMRINTSSDVVVRKVAVVERGWLLKTSSGKVARSANREKYLSA